MVTSPLGSVLPSPVGDRISEVQLYVTGSSEELLETNIFCKKFLQDRN